jgi:hypothetical protein
MRLPEVSVMVWPLSNATGAAAAGAGAARPMAVVARAVAAARAPSRLLADIVVSFTSTPQDGGAIELFRYFHRFTSL